MNADDLRATGLPPHQALAWLYSVLLSAGVGEPERTEIMKRLERELSLDPADAALRELAEAASSLPEDAPPCTLEEAGVSCPPDVIPFSLPPVFASHEPVFLIGKNAHRPPVDFSLHLLRSPRGD